MELFIIGNGFDVYHGIESRYSHFADYVEKHNSDLYDCVNIRLISPGKHCDTGDTALKKTNNLSFF